MIRGCGEGRTSRVLRASIGSRSRWRFERRGRKDSDSCRNMIYSTFQTKQLFFSQHFLSRPFRLFRTSLFEAKVRTQGFGTDATNQYPRHSSGVQPEFRTYTKSSHTAYRCRHSSLHAPVLGQIGQRFPPTARRLGWPANGHSQLRALCETRGISARVSLPH